MNTPVTGGLIGGRTYSTGKVMRSSRLLVASSQSAPETSTDVGGLGLVKSFVINEFEPIDGSIPYELVIDGKPTWFGLGDDRVDGLLKVIMKITEQEPEVPDN
jgi:hypothetical protein